MLRVLLVDDEPASIEIFRHYIAQYSLPIEVAGVAESGDEAIKAILELKPGLVFLDIQMPVYNGLQVMEEIKKHDQGVAFIIVTAYAYFEYAQKAIQLGAKDLLLKPVLYDQFSDSLARVLGYRYTDNPQFNALLEYIHGHLAEELTLQKCADDLAISASNIARLFKQHLDTSLVQYCNSVRIKAACEAMQNGAPIKEASEKVGFHNLNYFYRTFKKIMNVTPREYLNNLPK